MKEETLTANLRKYFLKKQNEKSSKYAQGRLVVNYIPPKASDSVIFKTDMQFYQLFKKLRS